MASHSLSVNFKVFGRVQAIIINPASSLESKVTLKECIQHTKMTAEKHGLVGWVRNEPDCTVSGVVQGPIERVQVMKNWLETVGSPSSKIDKCEFTNERKISKLEYCDFKVRK